MNATIWCAICGTVSVPADGRGLGIHDGDNGAALFSHTETPPPWEAARTLLVQLRTI